MLRARSITPIVVIATFCFANWGISKAQQLPNDRLNTTQGMSVELWTQAQGYSADSHSDGDATAEYGDAASGAGNIATEVSGLSTIEPSNTTYSPWISVYTSFFGTSDAGSALWDVAVQALGNYSVEEDPFYPSAGQSADSATCHINVWVALGGTISEELYDYDLTIQAIVGNGDGNSGVTLSPLDADYENWDLFAYLRQTSSSNPSASPVILDTTILQGFHKWEATQVTEVDDEFQLYASVVGDAGVIENEAAFTCFIKCSYTVVVP